MPLFVSSKSSVTRHGVFAIEVTPASTLQAQGTGVVALVGQFPWGPKDTIYEPSNMADAKITFAPPGMTRTGSAYLSLIAKAWPDLRLVRVLGSAAAKATGTLISSTPTNIATVTAKYEGTEGNSIVLTVADASDGDANHYNLTAAVTGTSGTTEDLIQNWNDSGTGTNSSFASLTQAQKDALRLIGGITHLANGRPVNGTYAMSTGANGSITAARYTGSAGTGDLGLALLEGDASVNHVVVDDPGNSLRAATNAGVVAHAELMGDRIGYINGDSGQSATAAQADVASYRNNKVMYVDPWVYIYDDTTGALQLVPPAPFAASVAAQLPPSTPISWKNSEVQQMLGGIIKLESPRGANAGTNTNKGIMTVIKEDSGGFTFEAAVTTIAPTDPTKKRLTRTRMLQYIARAAVAGFRPSVDAPNVESNRDDLQIGLTSFMSGLKRAQFNDPNHNTHVVDFVVQPIEETNTAEDIAAGEVNIDLDTQFSSGMDKIFLRIKGGETPVVSERQ
jgi:phage tail sheath protein FI